LREGARTLCTLIVEFLGEIVHLFLQRRHLRTKVFFVFHTNRGKLGAQLCYLCIARSLNALTFKHELFLFGCVFLNLRAQFCHLNLGVIELFLSSLKFSLNQF